MGQGIFSKSKKYKFYNKVRYEGKCVIFMTKQILKNVSKFMEDDGKFKIDSLGRDDEEQHDILKYAKIGFDGSNVLFRQFGIGALSTKFEKYKQQLMDEPNNKEKQALAKSPSKLKFNKHKAIRLPFDIDVKDIEQFETIRELINEEEERIGNKYAHLYQEDDDDTYLYWGILDYKKNGTSKMLAFEENPIIKFNNKKRRRYYPE
jgi:hypothetical protein